MERVRMFLFGVLFVAMPMTVFGTQSEVASMLKVVEMSDHVLTVSIIGVDMINSEGEEITDLNAYTGPVNKNTIRLICQVEEVHLTTVKKVPSVIRISLDTGMYYFLGQMKDEYEPEEIMLVVLKGDRFQSAIPGVFAYPIYELETIMRLFELKNSNV